ncbi:hypothetical protein BH18THE1_BH18THE1_18290 [soil metagenome]
MTKIEKLAEQLKKNKINYNNSGLNVLNKIILMFVCQMVHL